VSARGGNLDNGLLKWSKSAFKGRHPMITRRDLMVSSALAAGLAASGADALGATAPAVAVGVVIDELVTANHILFRQGVVDAFGHVSARHPQRPERFLLARNMAPALVQAQDIMEFTLDGEPVDPQGRSIYLERFIHSEVFRARPEVMAVVHSHAEAIITLGIVKGARLRPVFHMGGFIGDNVPVFEIRDTAGESTDLLIRNRPLGLALAQSLGKAPLVLQRGHGSTSVGSSLRQAVFHAVYAFVNARIQLQAMQLGEVTFLTAGEAASTAASIDGQMNRAWDMWAKEAAAAP
jgi:ribulose-5-phosphate 4-epimerase/fuculose-1-phosphate aldolase